VEERGMFQCGRREEEENVGRKKDRERLRSRRERGEERKRWPIVAFARLNPESILSDCRHPHKRLEAPAQYVSRSPIPSVDI